MIGRHVPRLEFLGTLLSEDQALAPHEEFYHRLLSFSMDSAEEFATKYVETESLTALYDKVLIPAIAAVEIDAHSGSLTAEQRTSASQRIHEIIDDFSGWEASHSDKDEQKNDDLTGVAPPIGSRVYLRAHIATNLPVKCWHSYFETRGSKRKTCPRGLKTRS